MTVCEPQILVQTNVLWHLAAGAQAVHVYFDDPHDPAMSMIGNIPGCHVVACDRAHWRARNGGKGRPASQMRRQTLNANAAQSVVAADWLLHIDADEFIWQDDDLATELGMLTDGQTELNLPVFERVFFEGPQSGLFGGAFRTTSDLTEDEAAHAFGPFAHFMKRGQYSHGAGKSAVPVRQGLRLGVHNATVRGSERWKRAPRQVSTTSRLLHFDGVTPLHWALKFLRYRLNPPDVQQTILQGHRAAQINWMLDQGDRLGDLQTAHAKLFALTPRRRAKLAAFDLLREVPFDPATVLHGRCLDLSPDSFDADLRARNPWLDEMLKDAD
jgi:hypothetical protein